jgi:N-acetylneuraminate synthase
VAAKDILEGETYSSDNLEAKRPGTGVSPFMYWDFLGKKAARYLNCGDLIDG